MIDEISYDGSKDQNHKDLFLFGVENICVDIFGIFLQVQVVYSIGFTAPDHSK